MNKFRSKLLSGKSPETELLIRTKAPRDAAAQDHDSLESIAIARSETRRADHRDDDRHRLAEETALAHWNGQEHPVELINVSGGGAMIAAPFRPRLWDLVELELGGCGTLEAAVRWIRNNRIGLEFAHETRIEADPATRDAMLRAVLARSFPDIEVEFASRQVEEPEPAAAGATAPASDLSRRAELRHPLIWNGLVHFNHESTSVRVRNISQGGALIEGHGALPIGAELLLELGEAEPLFATVHWSRGDQTGLRFHSPFDLSLLAKARPQLAPARWNRPEYLRDGSSDGSPWAAQWGRLSLSELKSELEGYLKR